MDARQMPVYVEFEDPINDYTDVSSFSFAPPSSRTGYGTNSAATKAMPGDANFVKARDSMSNELFRHSVRGTVFKTVTVEYYKFENSSLPYLVITLTGVMITSISQSAGMESVTLNYEARTQSYAGK
jgi:type VI protein secretion system component Hcp